jgi:SNF2 family DNA or RNA helicase
MSESEPLPTIDIEEVPVALLVEIRTHPRFEHPLQIHARETRLLTTPPWVRGLGKLGMEVRTEGWKFPVPALEMASEPEAEPPRPRNPHAAREEPPAEGERPATRIKPPRDAVMFQDRLLYLLQPPLENVFAGKQVTLPFKPYPYQMEGIAFLMPRTGALLADEMGLGKTMEAILSLRLLFHTGVIRKALIVCPKPLVVNWTRELRMWAEDVPFEVIGGSYEQRKASWTVSNCPLKLVNYELLTRDVELATDESVQFDIVVLDEAQRIKSRESKTAQVVRGLHRRRSWALTGTPIENRPEDLINIFAFVEEGRIPPDTPVKQLAKIAGEYILRRTKEDVLDDMPPKVIRDTFIELSPAQREAYDLAEKEGVIHLNDLGDTVTVQHVFELVMRLKQICNFDPRTGQSAKLEQLMADLMEVAESGRKAIVFSQWVEPLEVIARAVAPLGPLQYHGKISPRERQAILDQFKADRTKHVILMSYATGSVGLNLQFTNYVFLFDRWWNPAVEDQAINRAHRLGQKETVIVSRFITQGTIENRIAEVLEQKRALFNELIAQNGPPPALGLTQKDIFGLFNIRPPRRQAA